MKRHTFYCPICGAYKIESEQYCLLCDNYITPKRSAHEYGYYLDKSKEKYGDYNHDRSILFEEEIKHNPEFRSSAHKTVQDKIDRHNEARMQQRANSINSNQSPNQPKCPTCGSTNIQRISTLKRAAHGYLFGLFSNTARSQFECLNCKYKF